MPNAPDDLDLAQTLRSGEQPILINRYRIVRELGHGGMGSVYLAKDTHLDDQLVAIKTLSAILAHNKKAVADLKREAVTWRQLSHSAIVTLRVFEKSPEGVFLVLDYIEGETLEDYLADKGTLTAQETTDLLKPIAEALDYAHEKKVIHRDLKPANILIDKQGKAYLTDFGIAREMKDTLTRITGRQDTPGSPGTSGTLPYMSPEQVNGENPTPAQDIYSFGAMLYECLAGHPPFFRGQIEHQILNKPPDAEVLGSGADCLLRESVMRCLAKAEKLRPKASTAIFPIIATGGASVPPADDIWLRAKGQTEQPKLFSPTTKTSTPPADPPWERPAQPDIVPPAPAATPVTIHQQEPKAHAEEATGCLASLSVLLLVAVFFTAVIWAATTAPGLDGILRATLAGLPFAFIQYLAYGPRTGETSKSSIFYNILLYVTIACITGFIVVTIYV